MLNIAISGAAGRMGRTLVRLAAADPELALAAALERADHPDLGRDAGELAGADRLGVSIASSLEGDIAALIDFSTADAMGDRLALAVARRAAFVVGTTGLDAHAGAALEKAAESVPVLAAPNMSVGVNLLFGLVGDVARRLGKTYDVEIVETHHRFKADAPSGTALRLAERLADALGRDLSRDAVHGRQGRPGPRGAREIGLHAVRAGDVVGDHTVIFASLGERVEITHRAHSRDAFALGALRAAKFLAGKPPGRYEMAEVLGLPHENSG